MRIYIVSGEKNGKTICGAFQSHEAATNVAELCDFAVVAEHDTDRPGTLFIADEFKGMVPAEDFLQ